MKFKLYYNKMHDALLYDAVYIKLDSDIYNAQFNLLFAEL